MRRWLALPTLLLAAACSEPNLALGTWRIEGCPYPFREVEFRADRAIYDGSAETPLEWKPESGGRMRAMTGEDGAATLIALETPDRGTLQVGRMTCTITRIGTAGSARPPGEVDALAAFSATPRAGSTPARTRAKLVP